MRAGAHPSHGDARALTIGMRTMRQRFAESMHAEIAGSVVVVHEERLERSCECCGNSPPASLFMR